MFLKGHWQGRLTFSRWTTPFSLAGERLVTIGEERMRLGMPHLTYEETASPRTSMDPCLLHSPRGTRASVAAGSDHVGETTAE